MPLSDLRQLILQQGVAHSEVEADRIIEALHISGIILRYKQQVYLKPDEISDMVIRALPDTSHEIEARIKELEQELEPLEQKLKGINRRVHWKSSVFAYGGFFLLSAHLALFTRLTYWELSWDVMEPISYLTGQAAVLACYVYFLMTRRDFTYQGHFGTMSSTARGALMRQSKFDADRYERLRRDHARWQRYLENYEKSAPQP